MLTMGDKLQGLDMRATAESLLTAIKIFAFYQKGEGGLFGCGITESQIAAELKRAANNRL
ncbi:Cytochrome P450 [Penicillium fimorum]|uniref:Cytochrome P450 n=1 Tax=Penicillium fimorum TaxID=1882269 RepID=A0A9W9XJ23_9EURO|nr:Cytochrome P450 [Penicillium fimorum]